jgi:hypothetical protein
MNTDAHPQGQGATGTATVRANPLTSGTWQPVEGIEARALVDHVFPGNNAQGARRAVIDASVAILARCVDPAGPARSETGLVVGYVQSGKTLSFTAVAALARDNQYQVVIVMTGISTSLFNQSDGRLRNDLRLNTDRDRKWMMFANPRPEADLRSMQDLLRDWRDDSTPHEQKMTALVTVMKNHQHLANLRELLRQLDLTRVPVLIIDDEADQASMNTKVRQDDESTTYLRIGEVRQTCPHHTFLQYTATPQAPLLISLIDALSPSFVRVLEPGPGYVGGRELFIELGAPYVRPIPDAELAVDPEEAAVPPESLLEALRIFMIGVAAEYANSRTNPGGHRSMLVHPSHRTARHSVYTSWISRVKTQWAEILGRAGSRAATELLEEFRAAYDDVLRTVPTIPTFDDIASSLPRAIRLTRVIEVNASRGKTPPIEWYNAYSWILVSGQAVDRGFTVEGLTVTYMPRGAGVGNADTLQQRGRFFGYKGGYVGYCRVYLPADVRDAFHDYVEHELNVRGQLQEYQQPDRVLADWKRAFIMSPSLRPTRHQVLRLDYMRGLISNNWLPQAYPLVANDVLTANRSVVADFLRRLTMVPDDGHAERTEVQRHLEANDVSLDALLRDLLVPLKVPASFDAKRFTGLLLQLKRALERDPNELCQVFLMSGGQVRKRELSEDGRIKNLFQGENPVEPRSRRGSIYPGDRNIHAANRVTIQIHMLTLTDANDRPLATQVPVVAVWVPSRLAAGWIVQDEDA